MLENMIKDMSTYREKAKKHLAIPMPEHLIKERDGGGGVKLAYVGGSTVIRKLNVAFDNMWDWSINSFQIIPSEPKKITKRWNQSTKRMETLATPIIEEQPPVAHVVGTLTILGFGSRVGFGSKTVIGGASEQESCFKAAATDALKKASTLFGIALELYEDEPTDFELDDEEYYEEPIQEVKVAKDTLPARSSIVIPEKEVVKVEAPVAEKTETEKAFDLEQFQKIQGFAKDLGLTGSGPLSDYISEMTDGKKKIWSQLTPNDLPDLKKYLEDLVTELKGHMKALAIVDLAGFNAYIRDFSENAITEFKDLNPTHLRSFMIYLEKKLEAK